MVEIIEPGAALRALLTDQQTAVRQASSAQAEVRQISDGRQVQPARPRPQPERQPQGQPRDAFSDQAAAERRFNSRINNLDANQRVDDLLQDRRRERVNNFDRGVDDRIALERTQEVISNRSEQVGADRSVQLEADRAERLAEQDFVRQRNAAQEILDLQRADELIPTSPFDLDQPRGSIVDIQT
mgnify:CR=1 FL=1